MSTDVSANDCPKRSLRGWSFAAFTEQECVNHILSELSIDRGGWVVTVNLDIFRRMVRDEAFGFLCRQSALLVADGMPLVWASRLQRTPLPERVAGSSLISTISAAAASQGRSIFLLGGAPGTAEEAAEILLSRNPGLKVAGTCCPTISENSEKNKAEIERVIKMLTLTQPDIVYVALGSPKQEILINQLRGQLPGAWWLGVGISFSYLSGRIRRAPAWARQAGLEWFFRLMQEPRRLASRYLRDDLPFCAVLLLQASVFGIRRVRLRRLGSQR